jgi:hypothetical protein
VLRSQFLGFGEAVRVHPGWRAHEWVAVVSGPAPPPSFERPVPPDRPGPAALVGRWAACLALLTFAGAGWAGRLAGGPLALRVALAPATGLAVLVPVSLLVERLGIRVGSAAGVLVWIGIAFAGAVAFATRPSVSAER